MFKRKVPVILQFSDTECGIASLAMIFAFFKHAVSLELLREKCGVSRDGCSANTLIKVATGYGFKAAGFKVELEDIKGYPRPLIAYWNFNHYVVITEANDRQVKIIDPAHGRRAVSREEFDKSFTGIVIDIASCPNKIIHSKNREYKENLFLAFKLELFFLFLCLLILGIVPYLNSILSRVLIDQVLINQSTYWLPGMFILTTILGIGVMTATSISKFTQFKLYSKASLEKSSVILARIFQLPIIFYTLRQKGEIISLFTRFEATLNVALKGSLSILFGGLSGMICFLLMLRIDQSLAMLSFSMTAILTVVLHYLYKINMEVKKSNIHIDGKLYSYALTAVRNIETIRTCGMEASVFNKWHRLFSNKMLFQSKIKHTEIAIHEVNNAYYFIVSLFLLCLGAYRVSADIITVGSLLSYYALNLIFTSNILSITHALKEYQSVSATNARVDDIYCYPRDVRFSNKPIECKAETSEFIFELNNLTFFYNVHALPTLNLISLKVRHGEHIAFVGDTGSGKSSLAKLICGFYQAQEGNVYLLGRDILSYSASELSRICAYVSQDVMLFSGTILQNLTLGFNQTRQRVTSLMDAVESAISTAELQNLIEHRGLLGVVEECGNNFSGGEKQRIDLARAIIQNTPILILDEATSALDEETEEKIISNLKKLQKTVVFIAHRLSSIKHCDQIYVLKQGAIVEKGTHNELMERQGQYRLLVKNEIKREDYLC